MMNMIMNMTAWGHTVLKVKAKLARLVDEVSISCAALSCLLKISHDDAGF
jgi:hypothetical protein